MTTKIKTGVLGTLTSLNFADNGKAYFGAGNDLQIYHDGSNSIISDEGTGGIKIFTAGVATSGFYKIGGEELATFEPDGPVTLYHNDVAKLATASGGVTVTGVVTATSLDISGDIDVDGTTNLDVLDIDGAVDMASTLTMSAGGTISAGGANDLVLNAGASGTPDIYLQSGGATKVKIEGSNGAVGIGTTSPAQKLDIAGTAPNIRFTDTRQITWSGDEKLGGVEWYTVDTSANGPLTGASIYCENSVGSTIPNFNMVFATQVHNNASAPIERMRISSDGNVGIGTAAPAQKLHVAGGQARFDDHISIQPTKKLFLDGGNDTYINEVGANTIAFHNAGAERMRIDSAGTIYQGTTTPTLHSATRGIVFENGSIINDVTRGAGKSITLAQNLVIDSGNTWAYLSTDEGSYYQQFGGNHYFGTTPSGSAGADATVTTRMFIANTGNVGIGTDSPQHELQVFGSQPRISIRDSTNGGGGTWTLNREIATLEFMTSDTTGIGAHAVAEIKVVTGTDGNASPPGDMTFTTASYNSTPNERMRITYNGKVGIGETSPSKLLHITSNTNYEGILIKGAGHKQLQMESTQSSKQILTTYKSASRIYNIGIDTDNAFIFQDGTAAAERMRILSGGDVCIGKTSNDINTAGWHVIASGTYTGTVYSGIQTASASSTYHVRDTTNNVWKFYVENSGTVKATVTSIAGLSDERLKENIKDLEIGLTEVMSLKPRRFDWKEGEGSNRKNVAGFVAQEVETVLPDVIEGFMHDDLDDAKSVRMGDMIPTLVKAIQEQQTIIDDLKSRLEKAGI